MNNEEIRAACARAEGLASAVLDDTLRVAAFSAILQQLLVPRGAIVSSAQHEQTTKGRDRGVANKPKRVDGLKGRIIELSANDFFRIPKDTGNVAAELKTQGWSHQTKEISSRLVELAREKVLRRSAHPGGRKGSFVYSNW